MIGNTAATDEATNMHRGLRLLIPIALIGAFGLLAWYARLLWLMVSPD
ncbi:hypothetical protein [Bradyrhizobium sp. S3.2.12]